jgi:hypothetical protein
LSDTTPADKAEGFCVIPEFRGSRVYPTSVFLKRKSDKSDLRSEISGIGRNFTEHDPGSRSALALLGRDDALRCYEP